MKKVLVMVALVMASVIVYAFNDSRETNQGKKDCRDSSVMPLVKPANQASSRAGSPIVRKNARGIAPAAAKSDKFTARAL